MMLKKRVINCKHNFINYFKHNLINTQRYSSPKYEKIYEGFTVLQYKMVYNSNNYHDLHNRIV